LPDKVRNQLPSWLPSNTVSLGLDLQGGSYVLLEVQLDQVAENQLTSTLGDIRRALRKARIAYKFQNTDEVIGVEILDPAQFKDATSPSRATTPSTSR
jgi:preprotein translocase subunit SecD